MKLSTLFAFLSFIFLTPGINAQWIQKGNSIYGEYGGVKSGTSVSINSDGTVVAIGSPEHNGNGVDAGCVRIFEYSSGSWNQIGNNLDGEAAHDKFGYSVSLSSNGMRVAVGAPQNNGNGAYSGHVRIFENQGGTWNQLGNDIDGEGANSWLGSGASVSLCGDGTTVAIGSPENDGNGNNSGHVRVYQYQSNSWTQVGNDLDGAAAEDRSGESVSMNYQGTIVAIGAGYHDGFVSDAGHVRVYEYQGNSWSQLGSDIDGELVNDLFGVSVGLDSAGTRLVSSAIWNDEYEDDAGKVRVFSYNNGTWMQTGSGIFGTAADDWFGQRVSISDDGTTIAAGSYRSDANGTDAGLVKVFKLNGSSWTQIGMDLLGDNPDDFFGTAVNLNNDGSVLAAGASNNSHNGTQAGQVKVFEHNTSSVQNHQNESTLVIFPNPATSNEIHIESKAKSIHNIAVYDIYGKCLFKKQGSSMHEIIRLNNLQPGTYVLSIQYSDQSMNRQMIEVF